MSLKRRKPYPNWSVFLLIATLWENFYASRTPYSWRRKSCFGKTEQPLLPPKFISFFISSTAISWTCWLSWWWGGRRGRKWNDEPCEKSAAKCLLAPAFKPRVCCLLPREIGEMYTYACMTAPRDSVTCQERDNRSSEIESKDVFLLNGQVDPC